MSTDPKRLTESKVTAETVSELSGEQKIQVGKLIHHLNHTLKNDPLVMGKMDSKNFAPFKRLLEQFYDKSLELRQYLSTLSPVQKNLVLKVIIGGIDIELWAPRLGVELPPLLSAEKKVSAAATAFDKTSAQSAQQTDVKTMADLSQLKKLLDPSRALLFLITTANQLKPFRLFLENKYNQEPSLQYYLSGLLESQKENVLTFFSETSEKEIWRGRLGLPPAVDAVATAALLEAQNKAKVEAEDKARLEAEKIKKEKEQLLLLQLLHQQTLKSQAEEKEKKKQRDLEVAALAAQRKAQEAHAQKVQRMHHSARRNDL